MVSVADLQVLHDFKQLMIIKASIHSYDNRYIGTILFPDFLNDINQHAIGGITMIGVLLAAPEYCVNKESTPIQLQGMKTFDLLVSRLYTVPFGSIIIVEHHGIHAEHNDLRLRNLESPDEEVLQ